MTIESSTARLRERTRVTPAARRASATRAEQITVPGTDIEVTRTHLAIGAGLAVVGLALLFAGGGAGEQRGVEIRDIQ